MARILVWDLVVRVFHWMLAAGFVAAAVIALLLGEDSPLFGLHAIIGLTLGAMVVMRIVWGVMGSRYARFGSFAFGPASVLRYFGGVLSGRSVRHVGHNPGSAWAIFAMLALMLGLTATGAMLGLGNEGVKDIHELMAYAMVGIAGVHIAGVVLHTLRMRENIALGMILGRKAGTPEEAIRSPRPFAAVVFVALTAAWGIGLAMNYDARMQTVKLPVTGTSLALGEAEGDHERRDYGKRDGHDEDADD